MRFGTIVGFSILISISLSSCVSSAPPTTATNALIKKEPIIALVLGGGGAKGFAHVGIIKELETNGIHPNLVVGTSVGSFIGSLYASGKSATDLETLALTTQNEALTDFTLSYQGVIEGLKLRNFVNTHVNNRPIEDFPIRFAAIATEKHTSKKQVFTKGEAGLIVQASSSVPNIFIAPRIPEKVGIKYIDGGVSSMVPVDTAKSLGADIIIAVDLQVAGGQYAVKKGAVKKNTNKTGVDKNKDNIWSLMDDNYQNYQPNTASNTLEVARADIIIRPNVAHVSTMDTSRRAETIEAGAQATRRQLSQIATAIKKAQEEYSVQINLDN